MGGRAAAAGSGPCSRGPACPAGSERRCCRRRAAVQLWPAGRGRRGSRHPCALGPARGAGLPSSSASSRAALPRSHRGARRRACGRAGRRGRRPLPAWGGRRRGRGARRGRGQRPGLARRADAAARQPRQQPARPAGVLPAPCAMLLGHAGPASAAPGPAPGNASLQESHQCPGRAVTGSPAATGAPRRREALSEAWPGVRARRAAWSPALALLLDDVAGVLFRLSPARRRGRPTDPPSPPGAQVAPRAAVPAAAGADARPAAAAPAAPPAAATGAAPACPQSQVGAAAPAREAAALGQAPAAARAEAPGARAGSSAAPAALPGAAADGAGPAAAAEGRAAAAKASPAGAIRHAKASAAAPAQPVGSRAAEGGPAAAALAAEAPAQPGPGEAGAATSTRPPRLLSSAAPCAAAGSGPRPERACGAAGPVSRDCCSALQPVSHASDGCAVWAGDAVAEELCARIALYSRLLRRGRAASQHAYILL
jgi:hypothetical protein